jgi:hypothetical protein
MFRKSYISLINVKSLSYICNKTQTSKDSHSPRALPVDITINNRQKRFILWFN